MDQFPIRILSEKTGVAPTTLRAWERRYGLLKPERTPKGHRLYNRQDVQKVMQVVSLLEQNYTISKAINAIRLNEVNPENSGNIPADSTPDDRLQAADNHWEHFINRFLKAIELFDENRLEAVYNEALSLYPIDIVTANLLRPLLGRLGRQWVNRKAGIAEEHFFSAFLRNKVGARMHHAANRAQGSRLLLACLPGEFHELGVLLFGLSAMSRGYRLLFLGPNLPLQQVMPVLEVTAIDAIVLSGSMTALDDEMTADLNRLVEHCGVPVMLGGVLSQMMADFPSEFAVSDQIGLLGNDYAQALAVLERAVPAHSAI